MSGIDYGNDDLHNARLLGAYHARKGWGDTRLYQDWYLSLDHRDTRFLRTYTLRGEPGRTDIGNPQPMANNLVGLGAAVDNFQKALDVFGAALAGQMALAIDGFAAMPDFDGLLIAVERINLSYNLERVFIPAAFACWLAQHWPAWALPARLRMRLQNQMAHEGEILLRWWRWLGAGRIV